MTAQFYACEECREAGKDTRMPADEIGAALMQQHLKDEHGVVPLAFRTCSECGHTIGVRYPVIEQELTCKDHS